MTLLIPNLAISGFRSFGHETQYFRSFSKINIFIGKNNSGKSNILRFLHEIYPQLTKESRLKIELLDRHLPSNPPTMVGIGENIDYPAPNAPILPQDHRILKRCSDPRHLSILRQALGKVYAEKARLDATDMCWTSMSLPDRSIPQEAWINATDVLPNDELYKSWAILTNSSSGDRKEHWQPQVAKLLAAQFPSINAHMIPAIRRIGLRDSVSDGFDGTGIIEKIAKLQNPDVHSQNNKKGFHAIREFLRDVTDHPSAEIEIPYERNTILIHMDGRVLPIESIGSGLHEVVILAAAATTLTQQVVCVEEPELHLNPILQKKLLRYLSQNTTNQYFITTHSASLMDTPGAEVYHIRLEDGVSRVERATSNSQRSAVCEDLGYHPSDLLQANCVIWVEGPSDRIYLNWWLQEIDVDLTEGIHYSIMFYGGRLAAHLTCAPDSNEVNEFISLRRLNRRGAIIIDSDRDKPKKRINDTKRRLQDEFNIGPGHAWITEGREIENYLPVEQLSAAIASIHPKAVSITNAGRYEHTLALADATGKAISASKVEIAKYIASTFTPNCDILDLRTRLQAIRSFILESNPKIT